MNDLSVGELLIEANRSIRSLTWDIGAINARGMLPHGRVWRMRAGACSTFCRFLAGPG